MEKQELGHWNIFSVSLILIAVCFLIFMSNYGHHTSDTMDFANWTINLQKLGIAHVYEAEYGVNYMPFWLYFLNFFGWALQVPEKIASNTHVFKIVPLICSVANVYVIGRILQKFNISPLLSYFLLFNVAFLYVPFLWGQVDAIHTLFSFLALSCLLEKKLVWMFFWYILALNMKLQSIVFGPILFYLFLPYMKKEYFQVIAKGIGVAIGVQVLILLPYLLAGTAKAPLSVYLNQIDLYPYLSLNAFNIWHIFFYGEDPIKVPDHITILGFDAKMFGLILTFLAFGGIITFLHKMLRVLQDQKLKFAAVFYAAGLGNAALFLFATQQHERYLGSSIAFFAIASILSQKYLSYILFSVGFFLNLDAVLKNVSFLHSFFPFVFQPFLIALVNLSAFAIALYELANLNEVPKEDNIIETRPEA